METRTHTHLTSRGPWSVVPGHLFNIFIKKYTCLQKRETILGAKDGKTITMWHICINLTNVCDYRRGNAFQV